MEEKHIAIIKGRVERIEWLVENLYSIKAGRCIDSKYFKSPFQKEIYNSYHFSKYGIGVSLEDIWHGVIPKPVLEVGEYIYINDLDIKVEISDKYRTTNGEVVYEADYVIREVNDEKTEETRLNAVNKWFELSYPELKTFDELKSEFIKEEVEETNKEELADGYVLDGNKVKEGYLRDKETYDLEEKEQKEPSWFDWLNFLRGRL